MTSAMNQGLFYLLQSGKQLLNANIENNDEFHFPNANALPMESRESEEKSGNISSSLHKLKNYLH